MLPIHVVLWALTGRAEMSALNTLSAGKKLQVVPGKAAAMPGARPKAIGTAMTTLARAAAAIRTFIIWTTNPMRLACVLFSSSAPDGSGDVAARPVGVLTQTRRQRLTLGRERMDPARLVQGVAGGRARRRARQEPHAPRDVLAVPVAVLRHSGRCRRSGAPERMERALGVEHVAAAGGGGGTRCEPDVTRDVLAGPVAVLRHRGGQRMPGNRPRVKTTESIQHISAAGVGQQEDLLGQVSAGEVRVLACRRG